MTSYVSLNSHLYEIVICDGVIVSITKYGQNRVTLGEPLQWDELSAEEQDAIKNHLKSE